MTVGKVILFLEVDERPCVALLTNEQEAAIVDVIALAYGYGEANVMALPDGFRFGLLTGCLPNKQDDTGVLNEKI